MKKYFWITAFFLALAMVFTACPGGGDDEGEKGEDVPVNISNVFSGTNPTQTSANVVINSDGSVTMTFTGEELWGELVTPENARWDVSSFTGIKLDYKSTGNATIFMQDTDSIFIFGIDGGDGWGAVNQASNWETLTLPFSILQWQDWFGSTHNFGNLPVIKMCFQIAQGDESKKFEIRNITLTGGKS
jgi:hypothetical protein